MKDQVSSRWSHALLVCRKCSKRAGGARLAKALRRLPGHGKGRKAAVGVVEVGCLGVCPKRGVLLIDSRRPDRWRIVDGDQAAEVLETTLGSQSSPGSATTSPSVSRT